MGTKTLSISDDAYQRLRGLKRADESFSGVIQRLTGRNDLTRYAGTVSVRLADELQASRLVLRSRLDEEWRTQDT